MNRRNPSHWLLAVPILFSVSAAVAQDSKTGPTANKPPERAVKVLPDSPDAPAPNPLPAFPVAKLEALNTTSIVENPAGVALRLIPGNEVVAGSKVGFQITTRKQGYVILLDVDTTGKLTQIFPDTASMVREAREGFNLVRPGKPLVIPQLGSPYAGFEFVAQPPSGLAMLVAVLSDRPVQIVDLPDAPPPAFAPNDSLKYVRDKTRTLKIPSQDGSGLQQPNWSIDGKFYLIK